MKYDMKLSEVSNSQVDQHNAFERIVYPQTLPYFQSSLPCDLVFQVSQ